MPCSPLLEVDRLDVLALEDQVGHLLEDLVDLVAHAELAQAAEALGGELVEDLQRLRPLLGLEHALEARAPAGGPPRSGRSGRRGTAPSRGTAACSTNCASSLISGQGVVGRDGLVEHAPGEVLADARGGLQAGADDARRAARPPWPPWASSRRSLSTRSAISARSVRSVSAAISRSKSLMLRAPVAVGVDLLVRLQDARVLAQPVDDVAEQPLHVLEVLDLVVGQRAGVRLALQRLADAVLVGVEEEGVGVVLAGQGRLGAVRGASRAASLSPSRARPKANDQVDVRRRSAAVAIGGGRRSSLATSWASLPRSIIHWRTARKRWLVGWPAKRRKLGRSCSGRRPLW